MQGWGLGAQSLLPLGGESYQDVVSGAPKCGKKPHPQEPSTLPLRLAEEFPPLLPGPGLEAGGIV